MAKYDLFVRRGFLTDMSQGEKDLELRVDAGIVTVIKPGDILHFNKLLFRKVKDVRTYPTIEEALAKEDPRRIAPRLSKEQIIEVWNATFPEKDIRVFELTPAT